MADLLFRDVAAERGLDRRLESGGKEKLWIVENVGTGAAFLDADRDGRLDIFLSNAGAFEAGELRPGPGTALYRQTEGGRFRDRTRESGLEFHGWGTGVAVGDLEGDGDPDIFLATLGRDRLWRNRGDGVFEEIGREAGLGEEGFSTSAAFLDYDGDGRLDLYVAGYVRFDPRNLPNGGDPCLESGVPVACGPGFWPPVPDRLYHNEGEGRFREVGRPAGIAGAEGAYGLGVAAADLNDDGRTDVYVANDTTANFLWRNRGDGTFEDVALGQGVAYGNEGEGQAGMGVAIGDVDGNGRLDIFVTNYSREPNVLYLSDESGWFEESAGATGLGSRDAFLSLGWGASLLDVDQDGDLDLFAANGHVHPRAHQVHPDVAYAQPCFLWLSDGRSPPRFSPAPLARDDDLLRPRNHRAAASADFDRDGDLDLLVTVQDGPVVLLENRSKGLGNSVEVRALRAGGRREAIGARLRARVGGRVQTRRVTRAGGYLSATDAVVHFGLGSSDRVEELEIRWPDGRVERKRALRAGRLYRVVEGVEEVEVERRLDGT